ncbi:MAG: hypothetical protein HDS69_02390 [Bacteroidales bacterium]|nr:hypothetical protein [Bacteroidales bacterium]
MEHLPAIISAIGVIIAAWFSYNQYAKNKLTDLKVEQMQRENEIKRKRRADNSALVYGELWEVLHELKADRVYIVQPHPLGNESMISIYFESKRKGVESMKPRIQNLKMGDVARFCADLTKNLFMFITDIDEQVADRCAKSLLSSCGTEQVIIKRLSDNSHDWVGSIFCEFTHGAKIQEAEARAILHEAALNIQYILPAFVD